MSMFGEKIKNLGFALIVIGVVAFFWRPAMFDCSAEKDTCKIYKVLGPSKTFKYSYVEKCVPSSKLEEYHDSSEYKKRRIYRKVARYNYEMDTKSVKRYYPFLEFKDSVSKIYNQETLKMDRIQGFTNKMIEDLCNQVNSHETFKYKSNPYYHDMFSSWFVPILVGIFMLIIATVL